MALSAGTVTLDVKPDLTNFSRAMSSGVKSKLGGVSHAIGVGMKFAAVGLTAAGAAAGYAFKQFEDSEKIGKQTEAVIKSTGGAAKVTAKQVGALATEISNYSGIDDEAVQAGENMLLTFTKVRNEAGKGNDIFNQSTKVLLDMSTALGTDASTSAIQLGKALNDPIKGITALRRVGVMFTDAQQKQIEKLVKHNDLLGAQKIIVKELNKEFGGSAAAQATASGKMKVALSNLAETVGGLLAPAITFLLNKLTVVAGWLGVHLPGALKTAHKWFHKIWDVVGPIVANLWPKLVAGVQTVRAEFMKIWPTLKRVALLVGHELVEAIKVLWEGFQNLWPTIQKVAKFVTEQLWKALQALWETIKQDLWPALKDLWNAMRPVLKVVLVLAGAILWLALKILPVAIRILGKVIGVVVRLLAVFFKVVNFVGKVGAAIGNAVKAGWDFVVKWGGKILGWFKDLPNKVVGFISSLPGKFLGVIRDAINGIIDMVNKFQIHIHVDPPGPGSINFDWGGLGIPHLASGGIVRSPTMAMIGERGPEAVTPLNARGQLHVIVDNPHDFGDDGENVRHDQRMSRAAR